MLSSPTHRLLLRHEESTRTSRLKSSRGDSPATRSQLPAKVIPATQKAAPNTTSSSSPPTPRVKTAGRRCTSFSPQEREFAIKAIQTYKDVIRPIVQLGDLYRILSPYDHTGYSSQVYINEQKTEGVFFAYKYIHYINMPKPRFHFAGLNPNATYTLTELNRQAQGRAHWEGKQFTGKFLMDDGIELDLGGQYGSIVILLRQQ